MSARVRLLRRARGDAPLHVIEQLGDRRVEYLRLFDIRDMAGLLDLQETRALDHGMHLPSVFRRRAVVLGAADDQRRGLDLAQPVAIVQPRQRSRAAAQPR